MDSQIESSAHQYGVSTSLFEMALDGLSEKELLQSVGDDSNPMIWIVGHLTSSRSSLLNLLGHEHKVPWGGLFARGATVDDPGQYPPMAEMLAIWKETTAALTARFEALTDEELSAESPRNFPVPDKTIRGAISFMAYHEAYHVGQMAYLRKWLGKGSLVG